MDEIKDILKAKGYEPDSIKAVPFSVPENYFSGIEDRVRSSIRQTEERPLLWYEKFFRAVKAPAMLVIMFGLIFGMGYGVLSLTSTLNPDTAQNAGQGTLASLVEEGYIDSRFIEDYYDVIDISAVALNTLDSSIDSGDDNLEDILYEEFSKEELMEYYLGY